MWLVSRPKRKISATVTPSLAYTSTKKAILGSVVADHGERINDAALQETNICQLFPMENTFENASRRPNYDRRVA